METKYQLILIGNKNKFTGQVRLELSKRIKELGLSTNAVAILDRSNFDSLYKGNSPTFCIYFGSPSGKYRDLDIVGRLLSDAKLFFPVVSDLKKFSEQIPKDLRGVNGFALSDKLDISRVVSTVLEGLSLLRASRRLFISYKRDESSGVAIQLFEKLEAAGFDVFLDTHSVPMAADFQEELWHRLADTDVVVLLNTPGFLLSNWTREEVAKANAMSIGILQLIWPGHTQERHSELSFPLPLGAVDFRGKKFGKPRTYLTKGTVKQVIAEAESLRARSLAARQDNMINEFMKAAVSLNVAVDLQYGKFILLQKKNGKFAVIIPTVGVPQAFTYYQSEQLINTLQLPNVVAVYLLYDHKNIRDNWIKHLDWLDLQLKIKSIKIDMVVSSIKKII
ncbi:MAG TPA: toll/interleukin-1 receptor domain-containing protein [Mucilaginibacter sp.]